jgi:NADPH:quinone reductase
MKAILIKGHGGPDVLSYEEVDIRTPGPGEVLVRNRAIGVKLR